MTARAALAEADEPEFYLPPGGPTAEGPVLDRDTPLPAGPFRLSMIWDCGRRQWVTPYRLVAADGRTIASWIHSLTVARAVRDALNQVYPS